MFPESVFRLSVNFCCIVFCPFPSTPSEGTKRAPLSADAGLKTHIVDLESRWWLLICSALNSDHTAPVPTPIAFPGEVEASLPRSGVLVSVWGIPAYIHSRRALLF
jgi:hypothetical protein